jgi:hypothetical protein
MQNILIGKILNGIKIADDKQALLFITNEGDFVVKCDADCCSTTWIESVELPTLGFPALITDVNDLPMPDLGDMAGRDVVSYYGCQIKTDKGEIVIDYRNDSNGYYGGNLSWPDDDYFYGGVYGQNISSEKWEDIK